MDGTHESKLYLYKAGDVEFFGPEHMPFAILAVIVLLLFVVLPTLLLFLYPCGCFQQGLNTLHCNSHTSRSFMDVFLYTYKDGTNNSKDFRYFAGVFLSTMPGCYIVVHLHELPLCHYIQRNSSFYCSFHHGHMSPSNVTQLFHYRLQFHFFWTCLGHFHKFTRLCYY